MNVHWPVTTALSELPADEAHLWAVPLDHATQPVEWDTLSGEERLRAERFRLDEVRRQFVNSRSALRRLLSGYLGVSAADIQLVTDANGKPRLGGANKSTTFRFNLAHSGKLALVAMTRGCEVGVDIEQLRTVAHMEQIARRFFNGCEAEEILTTHVASRDAVFLRCWTAKEAVLKAVGTGLTSSLASFRVPIEVGDGAWVQVPATDDSTAHACCWVQQLTPSDESVGAVAFVGHQRRIRQFTLGW